MLSSAAHPAVGPVSPSTAAKGPSGGKNAKAMGLVPKARSWVSAVFVTLVNTACNYVLRQLRSVAAVVTPTMCLSLVLVGIAFGASLALLKCYTLVTRYLEALALMGHAGKVVVIVSFVPVSLPFLVGYSVLTVATGFMYGPYTGTVVSFLGAMLGASVSFLGTRRMARESLRRLLANTVSPKYIRGVEVAIDKHGAYIVACMRFVPLPFGAQNGLFAITRISFVKYFFATAIGIVPTLMLANYFGSTFHGLMDMFSGRSETSTFHVYILGAQLLVTLLLSVFVYRFSKRAMALTTDSETTAALDPANSGALSLVAAGGHDDDDAREPGLPIASAAATRSSPISAGSLMLESHAVSLQLSDPAAAAAVSSSGLLVVGNTLYQFTPEKLRHSMPSIVHETEAFLPSALPETTLAERKSGALTGAHLTS